jgi:hypothetical protein
MAKNVYAAKALTGGGTGALDAIGYADLNNEDLAAVITSTYSYFFQYNASNNNVANPESSPDVVVPDDNGTGTGAWVLKEAYAAVASDTVSGIVELATAAETLTGTDGTRAVTPLGLQGIIVDEDDMASDLDTKVPTQQSVKAFVKFVQRVSSSTTTMSQSASTIPLDDTIPQNTEGAEILTVSITPQDATNKLWIDFFGFGSNTTAEYVQTALFQDSTANALAATSNYCLSASKTIPLNLHHEMDAGTTSSTTFKIRVGGNSGSTTVNGYDNNRMLGGVAACWIIVKEVKA